MRSTLIKSTITAVLTSKPIENERFYGKIGFTTKIEESTIYDRYTNTPLMSTGVNYEIDIDEYHLEVTIPNYSFYYIDSYESEINGKTESCKLFRSTFGIKDYTIVTEVLYARGEQRLCKVYVYDSVEDFENYSYSFAKELDEFEYCSVLGYEGVEFIANDGYAYVFVITSGEDGTKYYNVFGLEASLDEYTDVKGILETSEVYSFKTEKEMNESLAKLVEQDLICNRNIKMVENTYKDGHFLKVVEFEKEVVFTEFVECGLAELQEKYKGYGDAQIVTPGTHLSNSKLYKRNFCCDLQELIDELKEEYKQSGKKVLMIKQ